MENINIKIPLITVITVCFNAVDDIEETIKSVIGQAYSNIEYIIIDGGSTDGTMDVINKYSSRIDYYVSEPDKGIYDAMNKGIKIAKGEWVNFMNAGDIFYSNDIIKDLFMSSIIPESVKVIYGDVLCNKRGKQFYRKPMSLSRFDRGMPFCHQSSFTRKCVLKNFDSTYRIVADQAFFKELYYQYSESAFQYVSRPIAVYEYDSGLSSSHKKEHRKENLRLRSEHKNVRWFVDKLKYEIKYNLLFRNHK